VAAPSEILPAVTTLAGAAAWDIDPGGIRIRAGDRMAARFPALSKRIWGRVLSEEPGSRARRRLITRAGEAGCAALAANDWELLGAMYEPDVVMLSTESVAFDAPSKLQGWDELLAYLKSIFEVFDSRPTPRQIFDLGGSYFCLRVGYEIRGQGSGVALQTETFNLYEIRGGVCSRQWQASETQAIERWLAEL
jgi:hypothetical protein